MLARSSTRRKQPIIDPDQFKWLVARHTTNGLCYLETQVESQERALAYARNLRKDCGDDLIKVYCLFPMTVL